MDMDIDTMLVLILVTFFILSGIVYLVRKFACQLNPPLDISALSVIDLEKGLANNSFKAKDNIYYRAPITTTAIATAATLKHLRPPRNLEMIESISLADLTPEEKEETLKWKIRYVQDSLKVATSAQLKCNLIIGLDSNSKGLGAYCVNLQTKKCQIYTYKLVCLPWPVLNPEDSTELGMKNLLFALMLWEDEINKGKTLRLYMENLALKEDQGNPHVQKVLKLLNHYKECEKVALVNADDICIENIIDEGHNGSHVGAEHFIKYVRFVQPAVDLCRWNIKVPERCLGEFYGLEQEDFTKTHCQLKWNKPKCRPSYATTHAYSDFLEKVRVTRKRWETPCSKCGFLDG